MGLFSFGRKAQLIATTTIKSLRETWKFKLREEKVIIGRKSSYLPSDNRLLMRKLNGRIDLGDIPISRSVSKIHFELTWNPKEKKYYIKDLSRRGTWINGQKMEAAGDHGVALNNRDTISIGDEKQFNFQILY